MPQMKKQGKTPEKTPNEMEINNWLDKEIEETVIRMLNSPG